MKRLGWRWSAAVVALCLGALGLTATTAQAGISGPCSASLAGSGVAARGTGATDTPIAVGNNASVPIVMSASAGLTHMKIALEFAGITWVVKDKTVKTPVYRDTVPVKNYAKYGVGLYKVSGTGTGAGFSCTGSALVKVKGDPATTVAGIGGIVATLLAASGLVAGGLRARGGVKLLRSVLTTVAGLVAALGVLVLLQEWGVLYPTAAVGIVGLVLGGALGAIVGIVPGLHHAVPRGTAFPRKPLTPAI